MPAVEAIPLPEERMIIFAKQVDQSSIEEVTKRILQINASDEYLKGCYKLHGLSYEPKPIKIYIDSYGGYVYQILGLINIIETSKTPVHTIVTGCAMSCGYILLISGHRRFAYPKSTVLYHPVSSGSAGQIQTLEEDLVETRRLQKLLEDMTLEKTTISKKKLKKIRERKIDWYINANKALDLQIIDEIITS